MIQSFFQAINENIGAFPFLFGLAYMLILTIVKDVYDNGASGQTKRLANRTFFVFIIGLAIVTWWFDYSAWLIFKGFVTLSCVRFWYVVGLYWLEVAYVWVFDVFFKGIKHFGSKIGEFWSDLKGLFSGNLYDKN